MGSKGCSYDGSIDPYVDKDLDQESLINCITMLNLFVQKDNTLGDRIVQF